MPPSKAKFNLVARIKGSFQKLCFIVIPLIIICRGHMIIYMDHILIPVNVALVLITLPNMRLIYKVVFGVIYLLSIRLGAFRH